MKRRLAAAPPLPSALTLLAAILLLAVAAPFCVAAPAPAPAPADPGADLSKLLSNERWTEHSWGVSLRPPLGCNLVERTSDDAVLRVLGDSGYRVSLYIRKSPERPTLEQLAATVISRFALDQNYSSILVDPKKVDVAKGKGIMGYLKVADPKRKEWVMGYMVTQNDPTVYVMLQLEAPMSWFEGARAIFEAMVASMEIVNPIELDKVREEAVARAMAWRSTIKTVDLQQSIIAHQWLRIIQGDKDVGYMHIAQKQDREMQSPGIRVEVDAMIQLEKETYSTTGRYFLADNNAMEIWSTQTTGAKILAPGVKPGLDDARTVSETGVRTKSSVEINRATNATNRNKVVWNLAKRNIVNGQEVGNHRMDQAYLSQVELYLLPRLLPHKNTEPMGFYAYYGNTGKIAYRTERVVVEPDGSYKVISRPTPEQPEQVTIYNAGGMLVKRIQPGGQILVPATKAEIAVKWKLPP
ncbi:MAG: hypothetical protein NTW19_09385 [Planctomycetota bacterium]|nr:hypothetical protein [Planctomycetota bacterium]